MEGPRDGPRDQATRGPRDQGTKAPGDQGRGLEKREIHRPQDSKIGIKGPKDGTSTGKVMFFLDPLNMSLLMP